MSKTAKNRSELDGFLKADYNNYCSKYIKHQDDEITFIEYIEDNYADCGRLVYGWKIEHDRYRDLVFIKA